MKITLEGLLNREFMINRATPELYEYFARKDIRWLDGTNITDLVYDRAYGISGASAGREGISTYNTLEKTITAEEFLKAVSKTKDIEATVIPLSYEIQYGTCKAYFFEDDFDLFEYDMNHLEDILVVVKKAIELKK